MTPRPRRFPRQIAGDRLKRPVLVSGLLGLAVIGLGVALMLTFPARSAGKIDGMVTPIVAFEFSRTSSEVEQLFGPAASPERTRLIQAMDRGNRLDFLFMVCYGAFLFAVSLTCARLTRRPIYYTGCCLAIGAALADALENRQLLRITAQLASGGEFERELVYLHRFTWLKWGALAAALLMVSRYFRDKPGLPKVIGLLGPLTCFLGVSAFIHRSVINELFALSMTVTFLALIIYCWTAAE